jgi:circadian clock protein KaiC
VFIRLLGLDMSSTTTFKFGVEGLDEYYPGVLIPGTLLVIAGHPGSGKTSMAAQLCHANALNGRRCLYVSTQETEEKFLKFMARFGFNFELLTASGYFRFLRLPLISSEDALDGVLESITSAILEFNPSIVVVDSINPMTKVIVSDARRRALLQNYFYNIAFDIKGLVVLIAEVPLGRTTIEESGDVEFVADGIIILRHELRNGLVARRMEIRKLRGAPLELSELPFTITAYNGIVALVPPRTKSSRRGEELRRYRVECKPLEEAVGEFIGGDVILVAGAPHELTWGSVLKWISRIAFESKTNMTIVSYRGSEEDVRRVLKEIKLGEPTLGDVLEKTSVTTLNPTLLSPEALFSLELEHLNKVKPGVAVVLGVDTLKHLYKLNPLLVERHLDIEREAAKDLGILLFKVAHITSIEDINWELPRSDVVIIVGDTVTGIAGGRVVAYRMSGSGKLVTSRDQLKECF